MIKNFICITLVLFKCYDSKNEWGATIKYKNSLFLTDRLRAIPNMKKTLICGQMSRGQVKVWVVIVLLFLFFFLILWRIAHSLNTDLRVFDLLGVCLQISHQNVERKLLFLVAPQPMTIKNKFLNVTRELLYTFLRWTIENIYSSQYILYIVTFLLFWYKVYLNVPTPPNCICSLKRTTPLKCYRQPF